MSPQAAPADRFADIVIITGLTKELEWFSKTIGVQFTRTARQGTSYLRGIHGSGTARFPSWPSANSTKG